MNMCRSINRLTGFNSETSQPRYSATFIIWLTMQSISCREIKTLLYLVKPWEQRCTNFPKIKEPTRNYRNHKAGLKQLPCWGLINVYLFGRSGIWDLCRLQLNCDGTEWRTGGEVKGKLANGVNSPSHYLGTWCIRHYYHWCVHLGCQQLTELTPTLILIGLVHFARNTKSGFCACAITFYLASTPAWDIF